MSAPIADTSRFRPDIEGLRALAVLLVVACHAGVPGLQGGYIGVDVFFVISGYLITRLLWTEWQARGRLDIPGFYARRLRRLLPAFALMLLVVTGAAWLVYSPLELPRVLDSAFAAALYVSNLHYALGATDYMAPSAKLDPLLHTWSLGVEEQFYLVWPLLLLAVLPGRRGGLRLSPGLLLAGVGLASFAACVYLTDTRQPLAFFLPLTRAWEFCLGAALVLHEQRPGRRPPSPALAGALSLAGLALVLLPATWLTERSAFPGMAAALPATGTALLIGSLSRLPGGGPAGRLLALPSLQWLGRLSYGWYLWHWPLLVIGRVLLPGQGLLADLLLVVAALGTAHLSQTHVEHPVRYGPRFARRAPTFAAAALVSVLAVVLIRGAERQAQRLADSEPYRQLAAAFTDMPLIYAYDCDGEVYDPQVVECIGGNPEGRQTAVLLGDSHAGQWYSAVHAIAAKAGWRLVVMTRSSCPVVDQDFFYERIGRVYRECSLWRDKAVARIGALRPALVIVASADTYPFTPAEWEAGTRRLLARLAPASGRVALLRDTPRPGFDGPYCLARREWRPILNRSDCSFAPPSAAAERVAAALHRAADTYPNVRLLDMTPFICEGPRCSIGSTEAIRFRDTSHLTDSFTRRLAPELEHALRVAGALDTHLPAGAAQARTFP